MALPIDPRRPIPVLADKGYDDDWLRAALAAAGLRLVSVAAPVQPDEAEDLGRSFGTAVEASVQGGAEHRVAAQLSPGGDPVREIGDAV